MGNRLVAGISLTFSTGGQLFFASEPLYQKNFPLDDQTRRGKTSSQPVNLRGARPVLRPLLLVFKKQGLHPRLWHVSQRDNEVKIASYCQIFLTFGMYAHKNDGKGVGWRVLSIGNTLGAGF